MRIAIDGGDVARVRSENWLIRRSAARDDQFFLLLDGCVLGVLTWCDDAILFQPDDGAGAPIGEEELCMVHMLIKRAFILTRKIRL